MKNILIGPLECILIAIGFYSWAVLHRRNTDRGNVSFRGELMMTKQQATAFGQVVGADAVVKTHGPFKRIVPIK